MSKFIEKVLGPLNEYSIMEGSCGFYAEVKTRNKFKLLKEYLSDFVGDTYKHPVFLSAFYSNSIDSVKSIIKIHIKFEYESIYKTRY